MSMKRLPCRRLAAAGASLTELAVVVAIIALIISVVAGGVKIQKASFIQGTVSAVTGYQSSVENFNQKYSSLPGDMEDATKYWQDTIDGDGDNRVEYAPSGETEAFRAWQQLSLAGLASGGFNGKSAGTVNQADIGVNVPASPRKQIGFFIEYGENGGAEPRNALVMGAFRPASLNNGAALSPEEAKALDAKTDDGLPENGKTRGVTGKDSPPAECVKEGGYDISVSSPACILFFPAVP